MNYIEKANNSKKKLLIWIAIGLVYILLVAFVDQQKNPVSDNKIGWGTINKGLHEAIGVHLSLDGFTDIFMYIALFTIGIFAGIGIYQLIRNKSLHKVDSDIITLGIMYIVMALLYIVFDKIPIDYRPIIMDGEVESSFPSSHTMIIIAVLGTAIIQCKKRVKNTNIKLGLNIFLLICIVVNTICRFISGVHWFTDIVGGCIFGAVLIYLYKYIDDIYFVNKLSKKGKLERDEQQ